MIVTSPRLRAFGASVATLALTATLLVAATTASGAQQDGQRFSDVPSDYVHAESIELIAEDGITDGFADGTFRPREDVRRDQMATFLANALRLERRASRFPDVPEDSVHATAIGAIAAADITQGYSDGTYRPLENVTRGQLATFLAEGLALPPGDESFSDVPPDYVHADAISALASSGITEGFRDGTYRPNELVKRDQMAAFLARGIPLPREEEPACPGSAGTASTASAGSAEATDEGAPRSSAAADADAGALSDEAQSSPDVVEYDLGDRLAEVSGGATAGALRAPQEDEAGYPTGDPQNLGPAAAPGFPITSALLDGTGDIEVHSQDLPTSRGARVSTANRVTATTTIPEGRRTWATSRIGSTVYVGQWGVESGETNLFRYSTAASGNRTATGVATVPSGGEFWTMAADVQGRLWAGTRAHNVGAVRAETGLGNARTDGKHVVHRIAPSSRRVTAVTFCMPDPVSTGQGVRADIKQLASVGQTLYVGTGQLQGGARVFAFEPGNRTDVPLEDVRDLTPRNVRGATGIFAMQADSRYVAFGTQTTNGQTARLVVVDRATESVRRNVELSGETRVDAIHIRGHRVLATGFSGRIYDLDVQSGAMASHDPPVEGFNQFHRLVQLRADGSLRGVTQQGVVWDRATDGTVERAFLGDAGAPTAPGLPHGLHVGATDVAVGASSSATLRSTADPTADARVVSIQGEGKALTSNPAGDTFIATYPNAGLWRVEAGGEGAEQVRSWNSTFKRPAEAGFDDRTGRVNVIARDDDNARSESRDAPQANFQFRPSRLFPIDPSPSSTVEQGIELGRGGSHSTPVPAWTSGESPVEASALLAGDTPAGSEVFVGDTFGGVQRVNAIGGQRQWYDAPEEDSDEEDRPIVDLSLVDGQLVVVHSGELARRAADGGGTIPGSARTVIRELDPLTGAEIDRHVVSTSFAVPDAITSGPVTVMPSRSINRHYDRERGDYWSTSLRHSNYSFGGPYIGLDHDGCALYTFEGAAAEDSYSDLLRTPIRLGACLPEDDGDADDGGEPQP